MLNILKKFILRIRQSAEKGGQKKFGLIFSAIILAVVVAMFFVNLTGLANYKISPFQPAQAESLQPAAPAAMDQAALDNNFILQRVGKIDSQTDAVTPITPEPIAGVRSVIDGKVTYMFKANGSCGTNPDPMDCLPKWSQYEATINNAKGISAVSVNGMPGEPFVCGARQICSFKFSTGEMVDRIKPTSGIVPTQMCKDDGTLKANANTVTGWGSDDTMMSRLVFKERESTWDPVRDQDVPKGVVPNTAGGRSQTAAYQFDTKAREVGQEYTYSVYAYDMVGHVVSSSFPAKIRPGHCCNGKQDPGEADIDCGGDCGACVGSACADNKAIPESCNHNLCASSFCTTKKSDATACAAAGYGANPASCCLCQQQPVITAVTPAGGFCSNDNNSFCRVNKDCVFSDARGSGRCNTDTPNGAVGNFVTISGHYFGDAQGKVYFAKKSDADPLKDTDWVEAKLASAINDKCVNSWQDNQIIAVVPNGAAEGPIKVVADNSFYDTTKNGPPINDFLVNTIKRPGLCLVANTNAARTDCHQLGEACGYLDDTFNLQGNAFSSGGPSAVKFGNLTNSRAANDISGGSNTSVNAVVPNVKVGATSVFTEVNLVNSNFLSFAVKDDPKMHPVIGYIDPDNGPIGQCITIYGKNFGTKESLSKVEFYFPKTGVSAIAGIDFPPDCGNNLWHDTYILVKVPKQDKAGKAVTPGDYKVIVTNSYGIASLPVDFTINDKPIKPCLCKLDPNNGPAGRSVKATGENFGASEGKITYYNRKDGFVPPTLGSENGWTDQKVYSNVPTGAATGPVKVKSNVSDYGNTLPFRVGKCSTDKECENNAECCGAGTYWSGICREKDAAGKSTCSIGSNVACGFGWTFTTKVGGIGDSCDEDPGTPKCDKNGTMCQATLVCDPSDCKCKQSCNKNLAGECSADQNKCLNTPATPFCNKDCLCEASPAESCSGYGLGQCNNSYTCPNSRGQCSSNAGGTVDAGVRCGDGACKEIAGCQDLDKNNICSYNATLNKCVLKNATCQSSQSNNVLTKFDAEGANAKADFTGAVPADAVQVKSESANKVYQVAGSNFIFSKELIPIDVNKSYYIFGRFKSVGTGLVCLKDGQPVKSNLGVYKTCASNINCDASNSETCKPFNSIVYFGLDLYDKDKKSIADYQVYRTGSDAIVESVFDNNKRIGVTKDISGWNNQAEDAGKRSLGFYYDGDTTKLPDSTLVDVINGAYNGTGINGSKVINLNNPLDASIAGKIIPKTTVVKNHYIGENYLYAAKANYPVSRQWENLASGNITGQGFNYDKDKFRVGTKYAKLVLILNYMQTDKEAVQFDDITFAEQKCQSVNGKTVWQINSGGASCPAGTYVDTNGQCTIGTPGQPAKCALEVCPKDFNCQAGQCVTNKEVCSAGSKCNASTGQCETKSSPACECCCRKDQASQDCCVPLTCEGACGSGGNFGRCTGCTIKDATTGKADPVKSNQACNCSGSSGKVCDTADAGSKGVCKDCSQLPTDVCSSIGAGVCCVDAVKGNVCRGGAAPYATGPLSYNYCAYYQCNADNKGCDAANPVAKATSAVYSDKTKCAAACLPAPIFGQECSVYGLANGQKTAEKSCDTSQCAGFFCINKDGTGPNPPSSCGTCCCKPGAIGDDQCKKISANLSCYADKGNCTDNNRGLCCGCTKDSECSNGGSTGCGSDTCCQARPTVIDSKPFGDKICRNALIQATFDQPMRTNTFAGNVMLVGDYGASPCPAGTKYLTAIYKPTILAKIKYWLAGAPVVNKLFTAEARADALALPGNFCTIPGAVSGYNTDDNKKTVLEFKPQKVLGANQKYYVIIKGDSDLSDATSDGVLSEAGIGLGQTSEKTFNGVTFKGKIWFFTTLPEQAVNSGVCKIARAVVGPASYLFQTNKNNTNDDDATKDAFDKIDDSDKKFTANVLATDGTRLNPIPDYNWTWTWDWQSGSSNVFELPTVAGLPDKERVVRASDKYTEGKSVITATAKVTGALVQGAELYSGTAEVNLMVCANPWPPVKSDGTWVPWRDYSYNCAPNTGDCSSNTNFELSYCRDAGEAGTADDLPAIYSDNAVIRGSSADILKELYFFRENLPDVSKIILRVAADKDSLWNDIKQGGKVGLLWTETGVEKTNLENYIIYYGTKSRTYTQSVPVVITNASDPFIISGLTNGVKYYFAVTAKYKSGAESAYSNEVTAVPADTLKPAVPANLVVAQSAAATAIISWAANKDDTVNYKIYYGATSGFLGASVTISKTKCSNTVCAATIGNLNTGTTYHFAITAIDGYKNESSKSAEVSLTIK